MARRKTQLELPIRTWGGKRRHAGHPRSGKRPNVPHRDRPRRSRWFVAHVTLRLCDGLPNLRLEKYFVLTLDALTASAFSLYFRIVEFSVQSNHLHLGTEASDSAALASGVSGLEHRIARRLNACRGRTGPVFADRYHARPIETPFEARTADRGGRSLERLSPIEKRKTAHSNESHRRIGMECARRRMTSVVAPSRARSYCG